MTKWIAFFLLAISIQIGILAKETVITNLAKPALFEDLIQCRPIVASDERLACYDEKINLLETARQNEEIIITDNKAIEETKRGLFGYNLPKLKILGKAGEEQITELASTIISARTDRSGKWIITLEDGAKWQQIDKKELRRSPKAGMPVKIRPAAFGSYFANIDGQIAIRMRRVN